MAIGYLKIQARTADGAVPLQGAQIAVLDDQGRGVYDLFTDENGETPTVPLETVSRDFSLEPSYTGMPYVSYNVFAQALGFNSLYLSGVPVFENETAIQPLAFVPMQEMQRSPTVEDIVIDRPAVSMQTARYQEGPGEEPRVLRQVAIPDPITVHLGSPASSAANVQVSFPDYVKNVASSEIYPTWPEAALRANIYAIITFALNRVFTEWYRSQGYSFDITNSTAYDQAFVYGRTVYESISRIVDEIFNEYVRRQGQNAPYFTSFCNGTTTTCAGLSQWGTVSLANGGLTPIQILRTYYPNDIEIAETDIITGSLTSYPGTPLRLGSTGLDVQTIQTYLDRIRRNYPAIPAITDEAGVFGNSTQAAVTKFQSIFGLGADGIVGKATWYRISRLYAAVTRLAELDSEGTTLGIGTVPPSSVLRQGSRGSDVITLQYLLNVAAEFYPYIPRVSQDGIFGSRTRQAVLDLQRAMGLNADGIVGPNTWRVLYDIYLGVQGNIPSPDPGTDVIEYVVRSGDTLWLLAQRYGTTVDAIRNLNGLTSNMLNIGQVLRIPATAGGAYFDYAVRGGDTLWLLSRRYGTTVETLKELNGLASDRLEVGQILRIPRNG
ncbi:MAG: LysM peptidoglycan-binding domain-containing protein [Lachnospiraceae bacterium]|nr:LysM peptidoglycan-binding domain-containing protein [Butyrivibrio sp.]MCM1411567.1 LysM peptidoglycan-binding domain-containing protein [Lachnospiraceae bacterium]